jgi:autotransporter-associated beta strand protein
MNEDSETPGPLNAVGDEALEARIVAWVLGDASAFEVAELERLCDERPELLVFHRRMLALHGLLADVDADRPDPQWQLPPEKRAKVEALYHSSDEESPVKLTSAHAVPARKPIRVYIMRLAACILLPLVGLVSYVIYAVCFPDSVFSRPIARTRFIQGMGEPHADFQISAAGGGDMSQSERLPKLRGGVEITGGSKFELASPPPSLAAAPPPVVLAPTPTAAPAAPTSAPETVMRPTEIVKNRVEADLSADESRGDSLGISGRLGGKGAAMGGGGIGILAQNEASGNTWSENKSKAEGRAMDAGSMDGPVTRGLRAGVGTDSSTSPDSLLEDLKSKETDSFFANGTAAPAKPAPALAVNGDRDWKAREIIVDKSALASSETTSTLSGADSYTGGTTVSGGTLNMDSDGRALGDVSRQTALFSRPQAQPSEDLGRVAPAGETKPLGSDVPSSNYNFSTAPGAVANGVRGISQSGFQTGDSMAANAPASAARAPEGMTNSATGIRSESLGISQEQSARERSMSAREAGKESDWAQAKEKGNKSGEKIAGDDTDSNLAALADSAGNRALGDVSGPVSSRKKSADMPVDVERLKQVIRNQEEKVEDKGKLLATIERSKRIVYHGKDSQAQQEEIKTALDAVDYDEARKEYEESQDLLQAMKSNMPGQRLPSASRAEAGAGRGDSVGAKLQAGKAEAMPADSAQLKQAIHDQEDKLEDKRKLLSTIMRTKRIVYSGDENMGASDARDLYAKLEKEKTQLESQLDSLNQYDNDQLMVFASGLNLPENIIRSLYPAYLEKKRNLDAMKSSGMGDRHPQVVAAAQDVALTKKQLDEGVASLRDTLRAQADLAKARVEQADALRNNTTDEKIGNGHDRVDFAEAKKEYDEAKRRLLQLKLKQAGFSFTQQRPVVPTGNILAAMDESAANRDPYSTFSLHVSDASFKLAKAALERGDRPDPSTVRPEEFYNAFDYGDPAPAAGEPVACTQEQSAHPVLPQRNLVRIAARVGSAGRSGAQPLVLTILLDSSGSMEREDRHAGLKNAVAQLASLLHADDRVTLVTFSRTPRLLADRLPGSQAAKLKELVGNTPSEGGTNLEEALKLGGTLAMRQKQANAQNRIVLLTDGAANLGDANPEHLAGLIHDLRQQGIAFDAAGIGADGLNDRMLEQLTRNGNGRYYVINNPEDADANFAKQLAGAFHPAAENVKVQVRFNQERVGRYKLIGFEQHRLRTEDFRNDKVDAAELAADEAGVALYQVETLPQGRGEVGEVSIRFRDASSGGMVERTWTIPYDEKAPAFDQAAPSMQLATLADLTAEKLRGSELGKVIDFQTLAGPIARVKGYYQSNARVADLVSMIEKLK